MFWPFTDFASQQSFRECVLWIYFTFNNIQLQVTKCYSTLQPQMTCSQMSQKSFNSTSSCNTPCCWASCHYRFVLDINHPIFVMSLNSQACARSSDQSVLLSFSAWQRKKASANMTCVSMFAFSHDHTCRAFFFQTNLQPNQSPHALVKFHLTFVVQTSTRIPCFFTKYRPNLLSSCMSPLRDSFMCLVRHFTASTMSTLFWATYANFITKLRYKVNSIDVNSSKFSICAVWFDLHGRIHFHPKTISSTDTFIQKRFHPLTLHPKHFHPILTLSSKRSFIQWTFIQKLFHPMNVSSNDTFIQWHIQPMTVSSKKKSHVDNQYCESVAGRRPAMLHMKVCWRSKGGSLGV